MHKVEVKLSLFLTKYHTMKTYSVLTKHHAKKTYGGVELEWRRWCSKGKEEEECEGQDECGPGMFWFQERCN
jgi:hypothetical protein